MKALIEMTGRKFGRLTVLSRGTNNKGEATWNCLCDCGKTKTNVSGIKLRRGDTKGCGCTRAAAVSASMMRHGQSKSRTYTTWGAMRERCGQPNHHSFHLYGGRGITVCERWQNSFENFFADMGPAPAGLSLDRINNDGNYEPGNCRWATRIEQALNRRTNKLVTAFGKTQPMVAWARELNIPYRRTKARISYGWDAERALTQPSVT